MTVDELIEALRLTSLHGVDVVIDATPPDETKQPPPDWAPGPPNTDPPVETSYPVVSVVGTSHDVAVVISARLIEVPPPPEQAPIDPGYPGQLSPPPPEFVEPPAESPAESLEEDPPLKAPAKKK